MAISTRHTGKQTINILFTDEQVEVIDNALKTIYEKAGLNEKPKRSTLLRDLVMQKMSEITKEAQHSA